MRLPRPLFLSTYPPEECSLATFTKDSADAFDLAAGNAVSSVAAIQTTTIVPASDPRVAHVINNSQPDAYSRAAAAINAGPCEVVSLQHDFRVYPGDWGSRIMDFVHECRKPIITTFHSLPGQPELVPRRLIQNIAARSQGLVVMTQLAARLLADVYGVAGSHVQVIPHGVPRVPSERTDAAKAGLGLAGRPVLGTCGLINRGMGLEAMIRAMPQLVAAYPDLVYLIAGTTDPQLKQQEGEVYRESLAELATQLGVAANVRFVNRYLASPELLEHLQACDVYVSPDLDKDQIVSGGLAYALATVGCVVSTPYLYAQELLDGGRGILVPFGDSSALATALLRFLDTPALRAETRKRVDQYIRPMIWPSVGEQYLDFFQRSLLRGPEAAEPLYQLRPAIRGIDRPFPVSY